jgi:hypothetical protein
MPPPQIRVFSPAWSAGTCSAPDLAWLSACTKLELLHINLDTDSEPPSTHPWAPEPASRLPFSYSDLRQLFPSWPKLTELRLSGSVREPADSPWLDLSNSCPQLSRIDLDLFPNVNIALLSDAIANLPLLKNLELTLHPDADATADSDREGSEWDDGRLTYQHLVQLPKPSFVPNISFLSMIGRSKELTRVDLHLNDPSEWGKAAARCNKCEHRHVLRICSSHTKALLKNDPLPPSVAHRIRVYCHTRGEEAKSSEQVFFVGKDPKGRQRWMFLEGAE